MIYILSICKAFQLTYTSARWPSIGVSCVCALLLRSYVCLCSSIQGTLKIYHCCKSLVYSRSRIHNRKGTYQVELFFDKIVYFLSLFSPQSSLNTFRSDRIFIGNGKKRDGRALAATSCCTMSNVNAMREMKNSYRIVFDIKMHATDGIHSLVRRWLKKERFWSRSTDLIYSFSHTLEGKIVIVPNSILNSTHYPCFAICWELRFVCRRNRCNIRTWYIIYVFLV